MKKNHCQIISILLFFFLLAGLPQVSLAQKDSSATSRLLSSRLYTFKAQTVLPMAGSMRQLTDEYTLEINPGKVEAYLPYFGRLYSAPVNPSQGGIQFTSTRFDYAIKERKRKGWTVSIKTRDIPEMHQMELVVFSDGTASLQVISGGRQPISFNGYITAPEKKK